MDDNIFYCTERHEKDARQTTIDIAYSKGIIQRAVKEYDSMSNIVAIAKANLYIWSLPIVCIPKERFQHIVPPGGKHYDPKYDPTWGAFRTIPCVELRDIDGTIVSYCGFCVPDRCKSCRLQGFRRMNDGLNALPVCEKDGSFCGEKVAAGCTDADLWEMTWGEYLTKNYEIVVNAHLGDTPIPPIPHQIFRNKL